MAAPAAADQGTYSCTVLVGTEVTGPDGGLYGASTTGSAAGVGECELHETQARSAVVGVQTTPGCDVHADTDGDAFVETPVQTGEVFDAGTVFVAFCDAGITFADNAIELDRA